MTGRLRRSTRTAGHVRNPRVEFFDVTCLCGQMVSGQRLPRPQAIECPACGEGLFVLPIDPYPPSGSRRLSRAVRRQVAPGWRWSTPRGWRSRVRSAWPVLAAGRLLLLAMLAAMTAGLATAFWLDGQSRRQPEAARARATAVPQSVRPVREVSGRVQDGAIVVEDDVELPEGARLSIRVVPAVADPEDQQDFTPHPVEDR